jgi:protein gp37
MEPGHGLHENCAGCDYCYAERFSERFRGTHYHPFETGFDLTLRPERLDQLLRWREPRRIFVNSMSDLFHKQIPKEFQSSAIATTCGKPYCSIESRTPVCCLTSRPKGSRP